MVDADDSTAEIVEGASGENDDARTQANRGEEPVEASGPIATLTSVTPRCPRDLPARRRAAANTVAWSQPVASTSQSSPQSTHCPVCLTVICDIAVCVANVFRTSLQQLQDVHVVVYTELTFLTPYVSISRRNSSTNDSVQCESKKSPPCGFLTFFPNGWEFLINFFTHLLYLYTRSQISIQKRDHPENFFTFH